MIDIDIDTISQAIKDLQAWEHDTGTALPRTAEDIAEAEQFGLLIDLKTGNVADIELLPDEPDDAIPVHLIETKFWLAGLEASGGATIQWRMTPDEYFAGVGKERA